MKIFILTIVMLMVWQTVGGRDRAASAAERGKPSPANQQFTASLYAEVGDSSKENTFFSPASIATALAMTSSGARGETRAQMLAVLGFKDADADTVNKAFAALMSDANSKAGDRGFQLSMVNRLWGQKGLNFLPAFLDQTQKEYGAGLEELDFAHNVDGARQTINQWVEKQTADKIKDLIKPGMLHPDARLVLTNAIYFKAAWAEQFQKQMTKEDAFKLGAGDQKVNAQMMNRSGSYRYAEDDAVQIVEMPYSASTISMVVVLPREVDGLAKAEKAVDAKWLEEISGRLKSRQVQLALPRFKMRTEFELSKVLAKMGMPLAFSDKADFSGMTSEAKLMIDQVIHQAYVDVNEEGTEAAAATAVTMRTMAMRQPEKPAVFRADHPFMFMIRDTRSGAILFMGKVMNPA
jgi:serpin B